jgi:hypothetical protein
MAETKKPASVLMISSREEVASIRSNVFASAR